MYWFTVCCEVFRLNFNHVLRLRHSGWPWGVRISTEWRQLQEWTRKRGMQCSSQLMSFISAFVDPSLRPRFNLGIAAASRSNGKHNPQHCVLLGPWWGPGWCQWIRAKGAQILEIALLMRQNALPENPRHDRIPREAIDARSPGSAKMGSSMFWAPFFLQLALFGLISWMYFIMKYVCSWIARSKKRRSTKRRLFKRLFSGFPWSQLQQGAYTTLGPSQGELFSQWRWKIRWIKSSQVARVVRLFFWSCLVVFGILTKMWRFLDQSPIFVGDHSFFNHWTLLCEATKYGGIEQVDAVNTLSEA